MAKKDKVEITVSITETGNKVTYAYTPDDPNYADTYGNVTVPKDTILDIKWKRAQKEKWHFVKPYVSTQKNVGLKPESRRQTSTEWEADNTTGEEDTKTKYYLYTKEYGSTPDPMLTLKGNSGPIAARVTTKPKRTAAKRPAAAAAKRKK